MTICAAFSSVAGHITFQKQIYGVVRPNWAFVFNYMFLVNILATLIFLLDAFRRLRKWRIEGETISKRATGLFFISFLFETIGLIMTILVKQQTLASYYVVIVGLFLGLSILATILYQIGIATV